MFKEHKKQIEHLKQIVSDVGELYSFETESVITIIFTIIDTKAFTNLYEANGPAMPDVDSYCVEYCYNMRDLVSKVTYLCKTSSFLKTYDPELLFNMAMGVLDDGKILIIFRTMDDKFISIDTTDIE
jgi:hypothetical protein